MIVLCNIGKTQLIASSLLVFLCYSYCSILVLLLQTAIVLFYCYNYCGIWILKSFLIGHSPNFSLPNNVQVEILAGLIFGVLSNNCIWRYINYAKFKVLLYNLQCGLHDWWEKNRQI